MRQGSVHSTIAYHGKTQILKVGYSQTVVSKMMNYFKVDEMKVMHDKFRYILFYRNKLFSKTLNRVSYANLLYVYFNQMLISDYYLDGLYRKAERKLCIL